MRCLRRLGPWPAPDREGRTQPAQRQGHLAQPAWPAAVHPAEGWRPLLAQTGPQLRPAWAWQRRRYQASLLWRQPPGSRRGLVSIWLPVRLKAGPAGALRRRQGSLCRNCQSCVREVCMPPGGAVGLRPRSPETGGHRNKGFEAVPRFCSVKAVGHQLAEVSHWTMRQWWRRPSDDRFGSRQRSVPRLPPQPRSHTLHPGMVAGRG